MPWRFSAMFALGAGLWSAAWGAPIYIDDFSGSGDGTITAGGFAASGSPPSDYWAIGDETTLGLHAQLSNSSPGNAFLGARDVNEGSATAATPAVATFINGPDIALVSLAMLSIDMAATTGFWDTGVDFVRIIAVVDGVETTVNAIEPNASSDLALDGGLGPILPTAFAQFSFFLPYNGPGTMLEELRIEVFSTGDAENVVFDNLAVNSVPEGGTLLLTGSALLLAAYRRLWRHA